MIKLSSTILKKEYIIKQNKSTGLLKERLLSLGFVTDSKIIKIKEGKSHIYLIKGMMIALRNDEADNIWVI